MKYKKGRGEGMKYKKGREEGMQFKKYLKNVLKNIDCLMLISVFNLLKVFRKKCMNFFSKISFSIWKIFLFKPSN